MNEKIKSLFEENNIEFGVFPTGPSAENLIVLSQSGLDAYTGALKKGIYLQVKAWMNAELTAAEKDPEIKTYLQGYDAAILDALCEIQEFGNE